MSGGTGRTGQRRAIVRLLLAQRATAGVALVTSVIVAGSYLTQPYLVAQVIEGVQAGEGIELLLVALGAALLLSGLFAALQQYLVQRMAETVVLQTRLRTMEHLLRLRVSALDRSRRGDLVSRVTSDTTLLREALVQALTNVVSGALLFVGALVGMLVVDSVLFAVTAAVIAASTLVVAMLGSRVERATTDAQTALGLLAASMDRALGAVRTVRASGATEREESILTGYARSTWSAGMMVARLVAVIVPVSTVSIQVCLLTVVGAGSYRVATGLLSVAELAAFLVLLFLLVVPLNQAFRASAAIGQAMGALARINDVLDLPREEADPGGGRVPAVGLRASAAPSDGSTAQRTAGVSLTFDDVWFTYPSDEVAPATSSAAPALRSVCFHADAGSRVALVGPSGAGKSTVFSLIAKFHEPDSGSVRVDGIDIADMDRAQLRSLIGYVEQSAPVLYGSLRQNLTLGAPESDDEACVHMLEQVRLYEVVTRSAAGLDAQVGEGGVLLSGGERQRLALARALLARPRLLLLDESTASLDSRNERLMQEAIEATTTRCTVVIAAHRLSTVVDADRIVVMDAGCMSSQGSHRELLESSPLYRELARHQMLIT